MLSHSLGHIFIYDDNRSRLQAFRNFFAKENLQIFGTDNLYQLLKYAGEITPDILIFSFKENSRTGAVVLEHFGREINPHAYPVIVIKPQTEPFHTHPDIAHYLRTPLNIANFRDILESYSLGNKHHQIMLLDSFSETTDKLHEQLKKHGYSCFEMHNEHAARMYLKKNAPDMVFVEYSLPFIAIRHTLQHPHIFYVDRRQESIELQKFFH